LIACLTSEIAGAAARKPSLLRTCIISAPTPVPLLPNSQIRDNEAQDSKSAEASDDDDEGGKASDEADEPHGFISPGSDTCVAISGTVNFGVQRDWYKANPIARATGLVPSDATSFPLTASFRIESAQTLASGLYVATAFEFSTDIAGGVSSNPSITEASVTLGPWVFGLASSRYDFWTGDDFVFVARVPSRTVGIIAYERSLTEAMRVSLSAEDVDADAIALPALAGRRFPDGVVRLLYEGDELTVHGAAALREVPAAGLSAARLGRAAVIGATWEREVLGRPVSLSGQIAGAVDAAPYLGSQIDRRTVRGLLFADDPTRGWSGVVSLRRDWTDAVSTSVYASRYRLSLPGLGVRPGRVSIDRTAANLAWKPVKGVKTGIEASVAWQKAELVGRTTAIALAGRQVSVQVFLERTF
jgi:hypothetical protein